ncbi:MAG TPA: FAD-binding oxidoreductase [Gammaproteobacteria bacterium]|nr:FAD-binding oxidoreductase [Gammaproteobacteria bacterium]
MMTRRQFCSTTIAAGLAAAYPGLTAFGRQLAVATRSDTSIPAISLGGREIELGKAAVNELVDSLAGEVLLSGHPQFDDMRALWNGMHDKRPALIARCREVEDVSKAVTFARENDLLLAVRGGGHSWPGKSVCDGGLMLDLSLMNKVRVDPAARRAHAAGGALLYGLDRAARRHGLITTAGVVSHTGVGGFTLGGGFGRLNRKFGLTIDNLKSAQIVTADGRIRRISAEQDPDLFWGIRGGGGNFGVVTEFEYQLHPFPLQPYLGVVVWPIEQAGEVLDFYADWHGGLSDELYVGPNLLTTPDGTSLLAVEVVYVGDPNDGEREAAPLFRIGKPLDNTVGLNDYLDFQTQNDAAMHYGIRSYAKSAMVKDISPEMVRAMREAFVADPRVGLFTHTAGGAVKRIGELDTAFPHRNAETMLVFAGFWTDPAHDQEVIAAVREYYASLEPFAGGYYDNIDFERSRETGNYGPAYARLARVKAKYDPGNLFRLNSNIRPAT